MTIVDFLLLLVVAGIIGSIGQAIGGYTSSGCAMSIVIGFAGAIIGRWLPGVLNMPTFMTVDVGDTKFPIIWSVIGAALLVLLLRVILGRRGTVG